MSELYECVSKLERDDLSTYTNRLIYIIEIKISCVILNKCSIGT